MEQKIRILGIAPYQGLCTVMEQCAPEYPEIEMHMVVGNMEEGLAYAQRHYMNYDIIISRANTASMISEQVPVHVVDIGIDYYDILRCIKLAQNTGRRFAILGFHSLTRIAKNLCELLQIEADIFSISENSWKESNRILDYMKTQGYETVICDMVPYAHAKFIGITPVLLSSSIDSVHAAIRRGKELYRKSKQTRTHATMLDELLKKSMAQCLVLDEEKNCIYHNLPDNLLEKFFEYADTEAEHFLSGERESFYLKIDQKLYSVRTAPVQDGDKTLTACFLESYRIPLEFSKNGLTILHKEEAMRNFADSFYSNTAIARDLIAHTEQLSSVNTPLMIVGEVGTGKDRAACIYYVQSDRADFPMYVINCSLLNDKTWNFLTKHYNSPFTDNGNTIYISNIDALSDERAVQLLSTILDSNLHIRNRLLFSCMQKHGEEAPHIAVRFLNSLGCTLVPMPPLRAQKGDIAAAAGLYLATLNQQLAKQIAGLDAGAAKRLEEYEYPCNHTQLKRILTTAAQKTDGFFMKEETIAQILEEEEVLLRGGVPLMKDYDMEPASGAGAYFRLPTDRTLYEVSQFMIRQVLDECDGNQSVAAKRLGISRTTLWRYLKDA